jgi:CO/xanthine dehydrogenase FAD-binding subunit
MVNTLHPGTLQEALSLRAAGNAIPYAGGTDLMIKPKDDAEYLFLDRIPELKSISEDESYIRFGAACTFTEVLENPLTPAFLREAVKSVGAPAIRNIGTVGGNICNASPKADSALVFYVTDALLRLMSVRGERLLPITDFYLGRNKTALLPDELLVEILMEKKGLEHWHFEKVGARKALTISRISFAALFNMENGVITSFRTAFGAIGDVFVRRPEIDALMQGKTIREARTDREEYLKTYEKAISPIKGRVSAEYRKTVCMNLLRDFLDTNGI